MLMRKRLRSFSRSDIGQAYFNFLVHIGMTPVEYGQVSEHNQIFLEAAYNEHAKRQEEEYEKYD